MSKPLCASPSIARAIPVALTGRARKRLPKSLDVAGKGYLRTDRTTFGPLSRPAMRVYFSGRLKIHTPIYDNLITILRQDCQSAKLAVSMLSVSIRSGRNAVGVRLE